MGGVPMHKEKQRDLASVTLTFGVTIGAFFATLVTAADMSHGKLAATIRSADYPCAQVLKVDSKDDNAWNVQCNSGNFHVVRNPDGDFTVTQTD